MVKINPVKAGVVSKWSVTPVRLPKTLDSALTKIARSANVSRSVAGMRLIEDALGSKPVAVGEANPERRLPGRKHGASAKAKTKPKKAKINTKSKRSTQPKEGKPVKKQEKKALMKRITTRAVAKEKAKAKTRRHDQPSKALPEEIRTRQEGETRDQHRERIRTYRNQHQPQPGTEGAEPTGTPSSLGTPPDGVSTAGSTDTANTEAGESAAAAPSGPLDAIVPSNGVAARPDPVVNDSAAYNA